MSRVSPMVAALVLLGGCRGASSSPGLDTILRVQGAQIISGDIATYPETPMEASVSGISSGSNTIFPGLEGRTIKGKVGPGASGVAVGLPGDNAFWALPARGRDSVTPELLSFIAQLDFSPELASSGLLETDERGRPSVSLVFRPITPEGRMGARLDLPQQLLQPESLGSLVITLEWTGATDLDLRVVAPSPDGAGVVEVWSKHGSNRPSDSSSRGAAEGLGVLDFDSNAGCVIDNRNQENVVWQGVPPAGRYEVRVDAFSLCEQMTTEWTVRATYQGDLLIKSDGEAAEVFGLFAETASRGDHGVGAGLTVFDFDIELQAQ